MMDENDFVIWFPVWVIEHVAGGSSLERRQRSAGSQGGDRHPGGRAPGGAGRGSRLGAELRFGPAVDVARPCRAQPAGKARSSFSLLSCRDRRARALRGGAFICLLAES